MCTTPPSTGAPSSDQRFMLRMVDASARGGLGKAQAARFGSLPGAHRRSGAPSAATVQRATPRPVGQTPFAAAASGGNSCGMALGSTVTIQRECHGALRRGGRRWRRQAHLVWRPSTSPRFGTRLRARQHRARNLVAASAAARALPKCRVGWALLDDLAGVQGAGVVALPLDLAMRRDIALDAAGLGRDRPRQAVEAGRIASKPGLSIMVTARMTAACWAWAGTSRVPKSYRLLRLMDLIHQLLIVEVLEQAP